MNTWDLMDKSRDLNARPEIINRLDAMVKAGWSVGRTWGFSLGSGLTDGPLGNVIADPTKVLETAPGEHSSTKMVKYPIRPNLCHAVLPCFYSEQKGSKTAFLQLLPARVYHRRSSTASAETSVCKD